VAVSSRQSRVHDGLELERGTRPQVQVADSLSYSGGAGTTPGCCIIAITSRSPQCSWMRPSSLNREVSNGDALAGRWYSHKDILVNTGDQ
jgi:hypothetical protein